MSQSPSFSLRCARRSRALAFLALALTLAWSVPVAHATPTDTVVPFESVMLQLDTAAVGQPPMLIVSGTIAQDVKLPATVRLTVPQGLTLSWAGEVLGGPVENDPSLEPVFEHGDAGFDTVTLVLTKGRVAQLELDAGPLVRSSGIERAVALRWLPPADIADVHMSVRLPAGSQIATVTPGARTEPGPETSTVVSLDASATAGQPLALDISHTVSQTASSPATSGGGNSAAPLVIFGITVGLLGLAGFAIVRRARPQVTSPNDQREKVPTMEAESQSAQAEAQAAASGPRASSASKGRVNPRVVILAGVAIVLGLAAFGLTSGEPVGTTTTTQEHITRVIGAVKADATFAAPLLLSEGDPAHESAHVFDSLTGVPGVHVARIVLQGPTIEVEYATGVVDEATIRAALGVAGYVAP